MMRNPLPLPGGAPQRVTTGELKRSMRDLVNRVQYAGAHISIERHGKVAAVLVPLDWYNAHFGQSEEA